MPSKPKQTKPVRVWVAVHPRDGVMWDALSTISAQRVQYTVHSMYGADWENYGITIRRATLTLDPVKPRRRT